MNYDLFEISQWKHLYSMIELENEIKPDVIL